MYGLFSEIGTCTDYSQKPVGINLFAWRSTYTVHPVSFETASQKSRLAAQLL